MPKKIIFIDNLSFIRQKISEITEISKKEDAQVLPLNDAGLIFLEQTGLKCIDFRDITGLDTYSDLYATARRWGMNWYKPNGADLALANDYSLGQAIEWSMIYFFCHLIRLHITISEVLKKYNPEEIIFIRSDSDNTKLTDHVYPLEHLNFGLYKNIFNNCIKNCGLKTSYKEVRLGFQIEKTHENKKLFLKKIIAKINILISTVIEFVQKIKNPKSILFFEGYRHFDKIMNSQELKKVRKIHLHRAIGPSLLLKLYSKSIQVESLEYEKLKTPNPKIEFDKNKIRAELDNFFVYRGVNLLECVWPRIEFLLDKHFVEQVYPDSLKAKKLLKRCKPDCVVTENDSTYHEKMIIVQAKALGITTVVLQNGTTVQAQPHNQETLLIHDFYPLIADQFLAFGEIEKKWFTDREVEENRIIVTGGPRFDNYYENTIKTQIETKKSVLILLNELWYDEGIITYHLNLKVLLNHIRKFIDLARRNPEIDFILRPHEDNDHWNEIFKNEISSLNNIEINRKGSLSELFPKTSLVIGYVSTALIEAAISRIPVISMDTGEYYNFIHLWELGISKRITNIEELESGLLNILNNFKEKEELINNINKNIRFYNFDDDGKAVNRIAKHLNSLASQHKG